MMFQEAVAITQPATQSVGAPITAYWPVMIFFLVAIVFPGPPVDPGKVSASN